MIKGKWKKACYQIKILCFAIFFVLPFHLIATEATGQIGEDNQALPWISVLLKTDIRNYIEDVNTNDQISADEIVINQYGQEVVITKLAIAFKLETTPEEFDKLLSKYNATITRSVKGTRVVSVRIPKPSSVDEYYSLLDQITSEPCVEFVLDSLMPIELELPSFYYPDPTTQTKLDAIDHNLAVRAPAAWNVKKAIKQAPIFAVADGFGKGDPAGATDFNFTLITGDEIDSFFGMSPPYTESFHGYAVLGTVLGSHDRNLTTGIYPERLNTLVYDKNIPKTWADIMIDMVALLKSQPITKIVQNASFGFGCRVGHHGKDCLEFNALNRYANIWINLIKDAGLESRVLVVAAAGNFNPDYPEAYDAATISPFASAALLPGLTDRRGNPRRNLSNTLVVENIVGSSHTTLDSDPIIGACIKDTSWTGGNISGIGTNVLTYMDPGTSGPISEQERSGTSYAAPQVAGLAAYIWSITPYLSAPKLLNLLKKTADPVSKDATLPSCKNFDSPAPIIDAYEAVLSLDSATTLSKEESPVRFALMNVNNSPFFNEQDLLILYNAYFDGNGDPKIPTERDWGRYDLNGDGWTTPTSSVPGGGILSGEISTTVQFDLDRSSSSQFGKPYLDSELSKYIINIDVSYDEFAVTDLDILCYYAYSDLYTGNDNARDLLLEEVCEPLTCDNSPTVMWEGLEWQCSDNFPNNWTEADTYCQSLDLDDKTDWRLPTKGELKSLVVCSNGHPTPLQDWDWAKTTENNMLDATCCTNYPACDNYTRPTIDSSLQGHAQIYWTSSPYDGSSGWFVSFYTGETRWSDFGDYYYARCVRTP